MLSMRSVLVVLMCAAAAEASAQTFEQQLSQFSQNAAAMTRQSRQTFLNAQAPAAQGQDAWHTIAGIDGAFTISMPGKPQYSTRTGSVIDVGTSVEYAATLHFYAAEHSGRFFAVETVTYPPELELWGDYSKLLDRLAMIEKNLDGKKWTAKNWTHHKGLDAVDAVGLVGGNEVRVLITAKGNQAFTAFYNGAVGTARSIEVNYYISTLNIR